MKIAIGSKASGTTSFLAMKLRRHKQEQHTQQKRDIKIIEYGSIIIAEEHNITSANPFP